MKAPANLPKQEELLVDYAERLANHRKGRCAVLLHLAQLQPFNRKEHHLRIAEAALQPLVKRYEGQLFRLSNADIVFVGKGAPQGEVDDALIKIRYMFREDPFVQRCEDPENGESFSAYFNLEIDYAAFRSRARELKATCDSQTQAKSHGFKLEPEHAEDREDDQPRRSLDPAALDRLERTLENLDLTTIMRKQYVYALSGGQPPQPVLCERYVSIPALQKRLLPGYDLRSDPWLFHRLTTRLDRRLMRDLLEVGLSGDLPISVNMHVSSILSDDFVPFVSALKRRNQKALLIEVPVGDLLGDMPAFIFARDFLRTNGQKVCIDGQDPLMFCALDRTVLQADLEKVTWIPERKDQLMGDWREHFRKAVLAAGSSRVVLCHCDDPDAISFGLSMGIRLFQGRLVDHLAARQQPLQAAAG